MRLRVLLASAVLASGSWLVAAPPANACNGTPCDVMCAIANTSIGRKLGLTCPL
jgi:hypothetical protein